MKKRQKASFLGPINSKITLTKEKEKRKRNREEEEMRSREKINGCTLSFYNGYFGDNFWPEKNCWKQKIYLTVTFSKIRLDIQGENKVITQYF